MADQIQFYPYAQSEALDLLLPILKSHLPFSNPLYNRIQAPHNTPSRHCLFAATFPPRAGTVAASEPFTILFADRSRHEESQIWLYNSLVKTYAESSPEATIHAYDSLSPTPQSVLRAHALSAVLFLKRTEIPAAPGWPFHPYLRFANLHPFVHIPLMDVAKEWDALPYMTSWNFWLASTSVSALVGANSRGKEVELVDSSQEIALPEGFAFARVRESDLDIVISTSSIPRQKTTMLELPNIAIFASPSASSSHALSGTNSSLPGSEPEIVAWAYIGVDGSLATLYVQPTYRKRGFATAVAKELLRRLGRGEFKDLGFNGDGGWVHSDVKVGNLGSEGVMRSIGAQVTWTSVYCRIDSEKF